MVADESASVDTTDSGGESRTEGAHGQDCLDCLAADILILHQDMGRSFLTIEDGGYNAPRSCYDRIVAWANRRLDS